MFWIVVLEKTLEGPLDGKEVKSVNPKGNQPWTFTGRTDAEAEAPMTLATWWEELTHCNDLMLGKTEGRRRRQQRMRRLDGNTDWIVVSFCRLQEIVKGGEARCAAVHGITKSQIWPSDRETTRHHIYINIPIATLIAFLRQVSYLWVSLNLVHMLFSIPLFLSLYFSNTYWVKTLMVTVLHAYNTCY